jgi:hypothetical protein
MHAAPPVRVQIQSNFWAPVLIATLVLLAALAMSLWLARMGLMLGAVGLASFALVVTVASFWAVAYRRAAVVLSWDGQRWFAQPQPQAGDPVPGRLLLQWDMDGCSLLRFVHETDQQSRWLLVTPSTVRGPWQDWRAALVQSQRPVAAP